jgi:hypothetical protein
MSDTYDVRLSTTVGSTLREAPELTARVRALVERLRHDPADVLTSEDVIRVPDRAILDHDDPNLAFYRLRERDLEIGFYVDRLRKIISLTSVTAPHHGERRS